MADTRREIQALVEAFVDDLTSLMQDAIAEASAAKPTRGRPKGSKNVRKSTKKKARKKAAPKRAAKKAGKGGRRPKRTPEQIAKLEDRIIKEVKRKPGRRMEELAKSLRLETVDLTLPVKRLVEKKKLKTKGQTRATQYFGK